MSEDEKAVLKTITYYDGLDYSLTFNELKTYLFSASQNLDPERSREGPQRASASYGAGISAGLENLKNKKLIEEANGFYFLKGRPGLPSIRKERNEIAKEKWRKTLKAVRWLQMVPYLRLVFASGSLALKNTAKESDLDVLIAVKHGRIWTARLLVILLLSLLGVRRTRYEKVAPDKICLNHFITDKSLYIPRKSIYTAQLYARLVPLLVEDKKLIDEFCEANKWVGEYVMGWPGCFKNKKLDIKNKNYPDFLEDPRFSNRALREENRDNSKLKAFGEKILDTKFGDWVESILRKYQLRRINSYHLTHKSGGRVKADDESLEFHPDSPELRIIEKYNKTMLRLGFEDLTEKPSFDN